MRADSTERQEQTKTQESHKAPYPFHFSSHYPPTVEARTPAIKQAEQALKTASDNTLTTTFDQSQTQSFKDAPASSGLPKLEIHLDDKLNYFAEHSLLINKARRIDYDFEHNPKIAKAVWGGGLVTMAAAAIGIGILKTPTAAAYIAGTGSEALGFGAIGGMAGGSAMQWWYTSAQLRDQLPSSRLPEFKAVRMHKE
ncbi:MAG: hypothetical protein Q8T09_17335 [Candidatus Melainabacteria bacterium]|nr:hypothetical protein [Candidatus Melainabacteria bacterium]